MKKSKIETKEPIIGRRLTYAYPHSHVKEIWTAL